MKKKFLTVAAAAVMTMSMTMAAFADTETGLLAHYGFDENLTNSVSSTDATQVGKAFKDAAGTVFTYEDGVNGKALVMPKDNTDGLDLGVKATGDSYTISLFVKTDECTSFAEPIVWYGSKDQSANSAAAGESWVGIWPGLFDNWNSGGPVGGCNSAEVGRQAAAPEEGNAISEDKEAFDWTMVTLTVEDNVAKLYYDGVLVGGSENKFCSVVGDDKSVYLGANYWDSPYTGLVDELYVYDRALSAEDVKELYTKANANGVAAHALKESSFKFVDKEPVSYEPPKLLDKNQFAAAADDTEEDKDNTMMYVIIAVVVVVVLAVVVAVVVSSKKKGAKDDEDDEE